MLTINYSIDNMDMHWNVVVQNSHIKVVRTVSPCHRGSLHCDRITMNVARSHVTNWHATRSHVTNWHVTRSHVTNWHVTRSQVTNWHVVRSQVISSYITSSHVAILECN